MVLAVLTFLMHQKGTFGSTLSKLILFVGVLPCGCPVICGACPFCGFGFFSNRYTLTIPRWIVKKVLCAEQGSVIKFDFKGNKVILEKA